MPSEFLSLQMTEPKMKLSALFINPFKDTTKYREIQCFSKENQ